MSFSNPRAPLLVLLHRAVATAGACSPCDFLSAHCSCPQLRTREPHISRQPFSSLERVWARKEHVSALLLGVLLAPALFCGQYDTCAWHSHHSSKQIFGMCHIESLVCQSQCRATGLLSPHLRREYSHHSAFSFAQGYGGLPQWQRQDYLIYHPEEMSKEEGVF